MLSFSANLRRASLPVAMAAVFLCGIVVFLLMLPGLGAGASQPAGFRALTGDAARNFALPPDVRPVRSFPLEAYGLTYQRYQQYFGPEQAEVLGGELTVYAGSQGAQSLVIGSHFPEIAPRNAPSLPSAAAERIVEADIGAQGQRAVTLMINPQTGRYFWRVETRAFASRWVHWIDAADGGVLNRYNALTTDHGIGVKGDTKDMNGPNNSSPADDLTTFDAAAGHGAAGAHWDLTSNDNRQQTFDDANKDPFLYYVTDTDNHWVLVTDDRKSPGQPALVDAQYYANVADDYFLSQHGLDWIADCGYERMYSVAHYDRNYDNAFWDGTYTVYGDGDGESTREMSGGLDIVAHETGHGVTDCTSGLQYQNEPGALNESISDVLGSGAEFFAAAGGLDPAASADWFIGEDVMIAADTQPGFRNMANPEEDGNPDHYSERYTGTLDNGGVHINSNISNHAYYLLVNGGLNASCASPSNHNAAHCTDGDTQDNNLSVAAISLQQAEDIFFLAFSGLPSNAGMCNARVASTAGATSLFGGGSQQRQSTEAAWIAVGLTDTVCGITSGTPTPTPAPTPCPDSDGDGWTDCEESFIGTSASNPCTPGGWPPDPAPAPDGDGTDHIEDVTFAAARFGAQTGDASYTPRAEIASQDGIIHIDDVTAFAARFGQSCSP